MTQHKKEDMQRINYKSDFDFILRLRDCKGDAVGFPGYDWEVRLWTPQNKANAYTAACRGGVCENCYNDNGEIHIVCDGHRLGQLCAELTVELPNGIYPDGYRKRVEPQLLGIELVNDAGDSPTEAQTEVAVAYAVIDAYDMAVASGYEGTREEYTASLGMLPDLAATVSDLRQGKREIAEALTEQGIPTAADAPMTEMAEGVRSLYAAPDVDAGSRDRAIRSGVYSHYDMVNEVNRHRRADYPYVCGCSFLGREVTLAGADATLLSDGTWIVGAEETSHVFDDDRMSAHYAIFYFKQDFYSFPWPQGVTIGDIAALDSHPCFSASSAQPFVSLFVDAEPADYDGHDFSFGDKAGDIVCNAVSSLPSGNTIVSNAPLRRLSLPGLKSTGRLIAYTCSSLAIMELPLLEKATNGLTDGSNAIVDLILPSLNYCSGIIYNAKSSLRSVFMPQLEELALVFNSFQIAKITELTLPSLRTIFFRNAQFTFGLPNLHVLNLPKLETVAGNGSLLRDVSDIDVYLPVFRSGSLYFGALPHCRVHFGAQQGANINLDTSGITEITILPGFTGNMVFKSAVLTVENLRDIIANLGDNTAGATYRIQMGEANMAKLTEDEIAVATAKNYTVL